MLLFFYFNVLFTSSDFRKIFLTSKFQMPKKKVHLFPKKHISDFLLIGISPKNFWLKIG
nr:MAG TPA: hypothetical protein [Caudoviricetes sp.]